jgi:hypothetical protein
MTKNFPEIFISVAGNHNLYLKACRQYVGRQNIKKHLGLEEEQEEHQSRADIRKNRNIDTVVIDSRSLISEHKQNPVFWNP